MGSMVERALDGEPAFRAGCGRATVRTTRTIAHYRGSSICDGYKVGYKIASTSPQEKTKGPRERLSHKPRLAGVCRPGRHGRFGERRCQTGGASVAQNFVPCDREQELLLPPSLREWLPEDHLAWFVLDAVDEIDLSGFYGAYREDGWGRAAFEPAMMLALLLYAYAVGERSSRGIERRCREDVAFRVLTANRIPDHATIARFRARHEQALADTFVQALTLCARAGLVSVGVVALDGSLLAGNASPGATRSYASIRSEVERMLAEAAQADAAEDAQLGEARGDELPAALADRGSRRERLRRCREELEREEAGAQATYQANVARRADWEAEHGRKLTGRKPTPPDPESLAKRRMNTTDPDTRMMKRIGGRSVQGYNVQVVAGPKQIILAAQVAQSVNDSNQLAPMITRAAAELVRAGIEEPIGTVLADGGYWNTSQIREVRARQIEVLIPA